MSHGTIKWFNDAKGYGFIADDRGDIFVHYSTIISEGFKSLLEGESVEFEEHDGPKGRFATRVVRSVVTPLVAIESLEASQLQTPRAGR